LTPSVSGTGVMTIQAWLVEGLRPWGGPERDEREPVDTTRRHHGERPGLAVLTRLGHAR
jgi:hypothetical protein